MDYMSVLKERFVKYLVSWQITQQKYGLCMSSMSDLLYQDTCLCWVLHGWWARWVYDVWLKRASSKIFGTKTNRTTNMACVCQTSCTKTPAHVEFYNLHGWWARWVYEVWPAALVSVSGKVFKKATQGSAAWLPYKVSIRCVQKLFPVMG